MRLAELGERRSATAKAMKRGWYRIRSLAVEKSEGTVAWASRTRPTLRPYHKYPSHPSPARGEGDRYLSLKRTVRTWREAHGAFGVAEALIEAAFPDREGVAEVLLSRFLDARGAQLRDELGPETRDLLHGAGVAADGVEDNVVELFETFDHVRRFNLEYYRGGLTKVGPSRSLILRCLAVLLFRVGVVLGFGRCFGGRGLTRKEHREKIVLGRFDAARKWSRNGPGRAGAVRATDIRLFVVRARRACIAEALRGAGDRPAH